MQSSYTISSFERRSIEPVIRTSMSTNVESGEHRLVFSGLTDREGAKAVARRIFDTYDRDRDSRIDNVEVVPMIVDAYRSFNRQFNPSRGDIDSYARILDRNRDGRISYEDIEEICLRYLVSAPLERVEVKKERVEYIKRAVYSPEVESRLELARRLFKQIDKNGSGNITEDEVPSLLVETYRQMGMSYSPTKEDVQSWMAMTDTNRDGQVTLPEYERLVLRSLKNAGFKIEEQSIVF